MSLILNELKIANKLTLNSSANLGIGKTTPNAPLDVNGNAIISGSLITTGNVGIGTSPSYRLDVAGAGGNTVAVRLTPDNGKVRFYGYDILGYNTQNIWMISNDPTNRFTLGTTWDWDSSCDFVYTPGTYGAVAGALLIGQINKNSSTYTHGYTALYTGGAEKLRLTRYGTLLLGDNVELGSPWWNNGVAVFGKNGTDKVLVGYLGSSTTGAQIGAHNSALNAWSTLNYNATVHIFRIQETEKMRLDANGNLGIGTTDPNAKLQIGGTSTGILTVGTLTNNWGGVVAIGTTDGNGIILSKVNTSNDTNRVLTLMRDDSQGAIITGYKPGGTSTDVGYSIRAAGSYISGSFGIGTNNPSALLHTRNTVDIEGPLFENTGGRGSITVKSSGTSNSAYVQFGNANGNSRAFIDFRESAGFFSLNTSFSGGYITFNTDVQSEKMRITSGGNVGIGTTSPRNKLEVFGATRTSDIYLFATGSSNPKMYFSSSVGSASINLEVLQDGTVSFIGKSGSLFDISDNLVGSLMSVNDASGLPILEVFSDDRVVAGAYNSNALVVSGSAVGVGKVPINGALDVSGSIIVSGSITTTSTIAAGSTINGTNINLSSTEALRIYQNNGYISFFNTANSTRTGYLQGVNGNFVILSAENGAILRFDVGGSEKARIDTNGNVGIGTTTPNAKLDVNGNAIVSGSIVSTGNIEANSTQGGSWGRAQLSLNSGWAGGSYPTIGSTGGSAGSLIMLHNPHIPFRTDNMPSGDSGKSGIRCAIDTAASNWWDIGLYGDAFHIYRGASSARLLVVNSSGSVGIGTSSPATKLEVYESVNSVLGIRANNPNTGTSAHSGLSLGNANNSNGAGLVLFGSGYTSSGLYRQDGVYLYTNRTGGITLAVETNNPLYFATNNTERMRIDGGGNVGIGTSSPGYKLEVIGDAKFGSGACNLYMVGAQTWRWIAGTSGYGVGNGFGLYHDTGGAYRLSVDTNGNVGIGTTTPSEKLHVNGGNTYLSNNPTTNDWGAVLENTHTGGWGVSQFFKLYGYASSPAGAFAPLQIRASYPAYGQVDFLVKSQAQSTAVAAITILGTGNVGIGTTSPTAKFHVNHNAQTTDAFYVDIGNKNGVTTLFEHSGSNSPVPFRLKKSGYSGASVNYGLLYLHMNDNTAQNGSALYFTLNSSTGTEREYGGIGAVIRSNTNGSEQGDLYFMTMDGGTSRSEKMRIISNGNVGIGTTNASSKLVVSGSSGDGAPTFRITSTGAANTFNWGASMMNAQLGSSRNYILLIGQAESTKNSGYIGFNHSGTDGSNTNFLTFGVYGNDNLVNIKADGNVGIGTTSPGEKLTVVGNAAISNGIASNTANDDGNNLNGGISMWSSPAATTSLSIFKNWNNVFGRANTLMTTGYATYHVMDSSGRGWVWRYSTGGSAGTNVASLRNDTGQLSIGTAYDWSSGYYAQLNISAGQGSATTYRDIDLHGSWAGGEGHAITATHANGATDIVAQIVFQHDGPGSRIKFGRLYHSGNRSGYPLELISTGADIANLVLNNGNIGVGITPLAKLHIVQNTATSVGSLPSNVGAILDNNSHNYLLFRNSSDNNTYSGLLFQDNNLGGYIAFRNYAGSGANDGTNGDALYYGTYTDHIFQAGSVETVGGRTEVFRIKQSGKTVFYAGVWHNSSDGYERFHFGSSDTTYFKAPNSTFVFRNSSDVQLMMLNTTGLAIGNATPVATLDVRGGIAVSGWSNNNGGSAGGVELGWDGTQSLMQSYNRVGSAYTPVALCGSIVKFFISGTEKVRIDGNGNVGIGTSSPTEKLYVSGGGVYIAGSTSDGANLRVGGIRGTFTNEYIHLYNKVGIGDPSGWGSGQSITPTYGLSVYGGAVLATNSGNVGIGTSSPAYKLEVNGSFAATTKSFVIKHPTKEGKKLVHGVTEGPEHSVFVRGKTKTNKIVLPEYWINLVDEETITVQLTSIGKHQNLAVVDVNAVEITIENQNTFNKEINCYYFVQAERIDIEKLQVEV